MQEVEFEEVDPPFHSPLSSLWLVHPNVRNDRTSSNHIPYIYMSTNGQSGHHLKHLLHRRQEKSKVRPQTDRNVLTGSKKLVHNKTTDDPIIATNEWKSISAKTDQDRNKGTDHR
ncbi:hypothetical protein AVEN_195110-1 [Araneus ventricosus]|uniref:Uncharacterized protein n=1 Tax=Araneus ventricosus TaxID=182803 RepID=A0A4Y2BIY3_ARAVE|nr:hypothetical protein AVEN_195110-1 [Araneus ventricosus]